MSLMLLGSHGILWRLGSSTRRTSASLLLGSAILVPLLASAGDVPDDGPALGPYDERITQEQITSGRMRLRAIRRAGLQIFATPFNHEDGYGEGPMDPTNPDYTSPGNRPMLGSNGTMLRVNGLDTQTCLECHSLVSAATIPATLGVGGAGGISTTALFQAKFFDVADAAGNFFAAFDGRAINPLSLFGAGGVQLAAKEMTLELQALLQQALASPAGTRVDLVAKGISFGYLVAGGLGVVDTSHVEGIDPDLVVRPFGRKGEFSSLRAFDLGATQFHMGMQPVEVAGEGIDADRDGISDELLIGEISALEIFIATMDSPVREEMGVAANNGFQSFQNIGCSDCHRPTLETESRVLGFSFPEIPTDPQANVFYSVDLSERPALFPAIEGAGLLVELFSDLKRHDMGDDLAEDFDRATDQQNREFITAKLSGVADTAPYLHDGRALTLYEAILWHGGEAQTAHDAFVALPEDAQAEIVAFLKTLRNPSSPNRDVIGLMR